MDYRAITLTSSKQYKLQSTYAYTGNYGIRQINGRYCVAVGSYFTKKVGTYCTRAYWEYRNLFKDICNALREISIEWEWIVDNLFKPKCEVFGFCTERKSCGRKPFLNV